MSCDIPGMAEAHAAVAAAVQRRKDFLAKIAASEAELVERTEKRARLVAALGRGQVVSASAISNADELITKSRAFLAAMREAAPAWDEEVRVAEANVKLLIREDARRRHAIESQKHAEAAAIAEEAMKERARAWQAMQSLTFLMHN